MEQTPQEVARMVRQYLQQQHPDGASLEVIEDGIYQEHAIWYVPILASHEPSKRYAYYEALAEVETDLQENDDLNVLLLPRVPEEATPLAA